MFWAHLNFRSNPPKMRTKGGWTPPSPNCHLVVVVVVVAEVVVVVVVAVVVVVVVIVVLVVVVLVVVVAEEEVVVVVVVVVVGSCSCRRRSCSSSSSNSSSSSTTYLHYLRGFALQGSLSLTREITHFLKATAAEYYPLHTIFESLLMSYHHKWSQFITYHIPIYETFHWIVEQTI